MEKELVNTILENEFDQLSNSEKESLNEWCGSEEEFDQMKMVFLGLEQIKAKESSIVPRKETKESLDAIFAQNTKKVPMTIWYNTVLVTLYPKDKPIARRPIVQIAALGLIFLLAYPFFNTNKLVEVEHQVAQATPTKKIDDELKNKTEEPTNTADKASERTHFEEPIIFDTRAESQFESDEIGLLESSAEMVGSVDVNPGSTTAGVTYSWTASAPSVSTHPDGIFIGASAITYSESASAQPAVLDLLTATF